jgi:hypothetical protein
MKRVIPAALTDLLALLLSGTVGFNNLLCSYNGEGIEAVGYAFSHHILKPEPPEEGKARAAPRGFRLQAGPERVRRMEHLRPEGEVA